MMTVVFYMSSFQTSWVNDHPVSDLRKILTRNGKQIIQGRWTLSGVHALGSVFTSGGVNGMPMTDFCMFDKPCTIAAKKSFAGDLIINGNLHVRAGR